MSQNEKIITDFYAAFSNLDAEGMIKKYADEIVFEDPAFGTLVGDDAKNMWRMLCKNGKDLKIKYKIVTSSKNQVHAHWDAIYTFSRTGRLVRNSIDAHFVIENGLIISHTDHFNLWKWSHQALGLSGFLLGWSPFFKKKLQQSTQQLLEKFTTNG